MKFINNIKMKGKLALMLVFPVIGLLYFSITGIADKASELDSMNDLEALFSLIVRINPVVDEIQTERGRTTLYIASKGKEFGHELALQRGEVDKAASELEAAYNGFDKSMYGSEFKKSLDDSMKEFKELEAKRNAASSLAASIDEMAGFYTGLIDKLIEASSKAAVFSKNSETTRLSAALTNFIKAKERAGRERWLLSATFTKDAFTQESFRRFSINAAEEKDYMDAALSLMLAEELLDIAPHLEGRAFDDVEKIRAIAFAKASTGKFGVDPGQWFKTATVKIESMGEVSAGLNKRLEVLAGELSSSARNALIVYAVIALIAIAIALALAAVAMRSITRPLEGMLSASKKLALGELDAVVDIKSKDEIGVLADSFNMMAGALREREARMFALIKMIDNINNELIESNRHKAAFLSNVSHELKTPLTHILGFSELLKEEYSNNLPELGRECLDNVSRSGQELLKLIEELLIVAKGSGGFMAEEMKDVNVAAIAEDEIHGITKAAQRKGQTLLVSIDMGLSSVKADEGMLRQIFNNLLDNAVKFTPPRGTIEFIMETAPENGNKAVKVTVKDTGPGIMPWLKDVLFTPFEIGEKTAMREYEGMGIGLAIAKRFVEFHGGKIWFESEPGQGSVFMFTIPIRAKTAENTGE